MERMEQVMRITEEEEWRTRKREGQRYRREKKGEREKREREGKRDRE